MDRQRTLMHNEYFKFRPVCHWLQILPLSPSLFLFPFVLSYGVQLWAMGNRSDSCCIACVMCMPKLSHLFPLTGYLCVCSLTPTLSLSHINMQSYTHTETYTHPQGAWSSWKFGQTLIPELSVRAANVEWWDCHSCLGDRQAMEEKTKPSIFPFPLSL